MTLKTTLKTRKRILFIGQAPSRETYGQPAFTGKSGKFLSRMMGMTQEDMLLKHDFVNLLEYWPGKQGKGDAFPADEAARSAHRIVSSISDQVMVLMGRKVAEAFNLGGASILKWYLVESKILQKRLLISVIPHPSGVNTWYNSPDNVAKVETFLRKLVKDIE